MHRYRNTGSTLIELMIGILISLLVAVSVLSTYRFLDRQKRMTVGTSVSFDTLMLATHSLIQDTRMAGVGMVFGGLLFCDSFESSGFLPPIDIQQTASSDSIRIVYANAPYGIASTSLNTTLSSSTAFQLSQLKYDPGDVTEILTRSKSNQCTALSIGEAPTMIIPSGALAIPITGLTDVTYSISNNKLIRVDNVVGTTNELSSNLVFMEIYGYVGGAWVPASTQPYVSTKSLSAQFGITAPSALRFFIIARQQNFNANPNGVCNATTQTTLNQSLSWTPGVDGPDVALGGADWQCYSYESIQFDVPLINLSVGARI